MSDGPPPVEDLPADLRDLVTAEAEDVAALYNGLQGMDDAAFADAFDESLATLRGVVDAESPELAAVLGLTVEAGAVTDATLLSVHVRRKDRVVHTADATGTPDAAVYVPVRPADFPPGSGEPIADLGIDDYREVVASMLYLRYQLSENDPDRLESHYRRPLARGLAAYAE